MIDVLRAAAAEVEDYSRVTVTTPSQAALAGPAWPTSSTCWPS